MRKIKENLVAKEEVIEILVITDDVIDECISDAIEK
jgi:hypothetical protein